MRNTKTPHDSRTCGAGKSDDSAVGSQIQEVWSAFKHLGYYEQSESKGGYNSSISYVQQKWILRLSNLRIWHGAGVSELLRGMWSASCVESIPQKQNNGSATHGKTGVTRTDIPAIWKEILLPEVFRHGKIEISV